MPDFPITAEEITADWLSATLSECCPGVEVDEVDILRQMAGTNHNALLELAYRGEVDAPQRLFVKMAPQEPNQRELVKLSRMAERETGFYAQLAEHVSLRVPRSYFSRYDEDSGCFLILLEDLVTSGASFAQPDDRFSLALAEGLVADLARLHTSLQTDPEIRRNAQWVGPPTRLKEYGVGMLQAALENCAATLDDAFIELARVYCDHHDEAHDAWDRDAWALIHGDCHWGNLFVEDDRIGFLDWGLMATMNGMRDLSFFLCLGMHTEGRREHEARLIQLYCDQVRECGGPDITEQEAWQQYRLHAAYTVTASAPAAVFPLIREKSDFEPEVVNEFLARTTAAIRDLDAGSALLEAMA